MYNNIMLDRDRPRKVVFYGRVSTDHEAQLSALENQIQWYEDQKKYHPNWNVVDRYIDEGITGTQAKKRPSFAPVVGISFCTSTGDKYPARSLCGIIF